jgi:outer membrane protein OmpA-like peptidoglycan-associated protein
MQRLLLRNSIQAKLTVNAPDDKYEQEADRVADHVMRMSISGADDTPPSIQRTCSACSKETEPIQRACKSCDEKLHRQEAGGAGMEISDAAEVPGIQRMCDECEDELHRKATNESGSEISGAIESQIKALERGGQPLPDSERNFFEPRFGQNFDRVRIHTDAHAAAAAHSINALAYTKGTDVVFGAGQYRPGTDAGRTLLAHELSHVVQQGGVKSMLVQRQAHLSFAPPGLNLRCVLIPNAGPAAGGLPFMFAVNSSTFAPTPAEITSLDNFVDRWHDAGSFDDIQVQGFASIDGDEGPNWTLSCERAEALKNALTARGVSASRIIVQAHGESTAAPTEPGNRRAVVSMVPTPTATTSPVVSLPSTGPGCPQQVTLEVSRGNDDQMECQYQDAVIRVTMVLDPCACSQGSPIPITILFHAVLDGKSFSNPAGTIRETQASTIGQRFFLREEGTSNDSPTLVHSGDIGRPGDPDDTLDTELTLQRTVDCIGSSLSGRVLVTNGAFTQQVIRWAASADNTGVQSATLDLQQRRVPGRVLPPLRSIGSPYPPFPGVPRDNRCSCHPITGIHQGSTCPARFLTGSSVGGP